MDTTTAEEENVSNSLEENTTDLLYNVVHKQPQSYENFVSNFTFLTHDDIEKSEVKKLSKRDKMAGGRNSMNPDDVNNTTSSTNLEINERVPNVTNEDELEEEVLEEDILINTGEEEKSNKSKRNFTKFDNFVDNEDNDNNDDVSDIGSGYLASFHESDLKAESENLKSPKHLNQKTQRESTNKIVNENSVPQNVMESEIEPSDLACDIKIAECPYQPDENGFLLNPGEVERKTTPTDLSSIQHTTYLEYSCKYAESIDKTTKSVDETEKSADETAKSVDETTKSADATAKSADKTAKSIDEAEKSVDKTAEQSDKIAEENIFPCTDEVEEFKLDDNFDYDNIVLTSKYTQQETNYLNSFRENAEKSS